MTFFKVNSLGEVMRAAILLAVLLLTGCGGGGAGGTNDTASTSAPSDSSNNITPPPAAAPVTTNVTFSWNAPDGRVDNSSIVMSEIGGYRVYTGSSTDSLTLVAEINDAYTTQYVFNDVSAGVHYFAVKAFDDRGVESDFSSVISETI